MKVQILVGQRFRTTFEYIMAYVNAKYLPIRLLMRTEFKLRVNIKSAWLTSLVHHYVFRDRKSYIAQSRYFILFK